jgi:hypothetical protein
MGEGMHTLIVPQHFITADKEPSYPHRLPWIDGMDAMPKIEDADYTEEGYTVLEFDGDWNN